MDKTIKKPSAAWVFLKENWLRIYYGIISFILIYVVIKSPLFQAVFWDVKLNNTTLILVFSFCLITLFLKPVLKINKEITVFILTAIIGLLPIFISEATKTYGDLNELTVLHGSNCVMANNIKTNIIDQRKDNVVTTSFETNLYFQKIFVLSSQYGKEKTQRYIRLANIFKYLNFLIEEFNKFRPNNLVASEELYKDLANSIGEALNLCNELKM